MTTVTSSGLDTSYSNDNGERLGIAPDAVPLCPGLGSPSSKGVGDAGHGQEWTSVTLSRFFTHPFLTHLISHDRIQHDSFGEFVCLTAAHNGHTLLFEHHSDHGSACTSEHGAIR